jgi:hypothetical protein
MSVLAYVFLIFCALGWVLARIYYKEMSFLRRELIKIAILRGLDLTGVVEEKEILRASQELVNELDTKHGK